MVSGRLERSRWRLTKHVKRYKLAQTGSQGINIEDLVYVLQRADKLAGLKNADGVVSRGIDTRVITIFGKYTLHVSSHHFAKLCLLETVYSKLWTV